MREAGIFAQVTTFAKLVPLAVIALFGLFFVDWSHFAEFNPSGESLWHAAGALAPLTMFAYLGLESATVPAGDVRDPERTIPRATMLGIGVAATVYLLGTIAVMGILPRDAWPVAGSILGRGECDLGSVGRRCARTRGDALVDRRIERLDPAHGSGAEGGRAGRALPGDVRPRVRARRTRVRHRASVSLATVLLLIEASGSDHLVGFYRAIVNLGTMTAVFPTSSARAPR